MPSSRQRVSGLYGRGVSRGDLTLFEDLAPGARVEGDLQDVAGLHALLAVKGLGPKKVLRLAERVGSFRRLGELSDDDLRSLVGAEASAGLRAISLDVAMPELPEGVSVVGFFDAEYPAALRAIPDPPPLLWMQGHLSARDAVAVVGTRKPTDWSVRTARLVAESAVTRGCAVVSGLALGTDSVAHEACLDAGGTTIAVLGSGVDKPSPAANRELAGRIVEAGGCLLAEVPPGTKTSPRLLVARDRLQSGLSLATFVVQSGIPGGTLHTARFTVEQDRLLVVALPKRSTTPVDGADPYAGNVALADSSGCNPSVLRADGSLSTKIAARRPVADLVVSKEEDLTAAWERIDELRAGPPGVARGQTGPGGTSGHDSSTR